MALEKTYLSELAGQYIRIKTGINAYVFSKGMSSGGTAGVVKGDVFILSGNVYVENGEYVWFELKTDIPDHIVCLYAGDVENILMDADDGSMGSFLGFLKLPFALPVSAEFSNKLNALLKKIALAAGLIGVLLIAKKTEN